MISRIKKTIDLDKNFVIFNVLYNSVVNFSKKKKRVISLDISSFIFEQYLNVKYYKVLY